MNKSSHAKTAPALLAAAKGSDLNGKRMNILLISNNHLRNLDGGGFRSWSME